MVQPDDTRAAQSARIASWTRVTVLVVIGLMVLVLGRVTQLKLRPGAQLEAAMVPQTSSRQEMGRRGDLLDIRGRVLATSTVGYRLFVDPTQVDDPATIAVDIAAVLGITPLDVDRRILERSSPQYAVIEPLLNDGQVEAIRAAGLRGVGLEPRLVRHYPNDDLAAAVVGLVGAEHTGLSGTEHALDHELEQHPGRLTWLRDAGQRTLWIEPAGHEAAEHGADVHLSIDLVVQELTLRHLREAVDRVNAAGGRAVVMDPRTGELLAMVDVLHPRPDREPLTVDPGREQHPSLARNRCVSDPYEPGSTLKPFVWAIATELGVADPNEVLPTPESGPWRTPYGRWIQDSHYHGPLTWREVLVHSLNTGMAMVAERMTHEQMRDTLDRFGFGERTRCGVPGETAGLVTPAARWSRYTQSSVAFGHEIAVTPVQMVRAFAALARDGTLPPVRITAESNQDARFRFVRRACNPSTAELVRTVLAEVVDHGTGTAARSTRYAVFGKTGTAQLPRPEGGGYFDDRYVSSFIAAAPVDEPRLVVLCVIDDPDRSRGHWGGQVAGPAVRTIIEETLDYLGVGERSAEVGSMK